ncbi:MAG: DinB family protein [Candidatus Dormibacteraeota bacterium]|nr:DinB family protein [Candidatus Dormibacteraeota bacterium]
MNNDSGLREELAATLREAEAAEQQLVCLCADGVTDTGEPWSAKDHVAHLAAWREHAVTVLSNAAGGSESPPVGDIDAYNDAVFLANREAGAAAVRQYSASTYATLIATLEALPADALHRRRDGAGPVWTVLLGYGCGHVAEHLGYWHAQHGDAGAADRAAQWGFEVVERHCHDSLAVATAAYNLACHYARSGRITEALPLLRRALQARPELRSFARTDTDLDPVRADPGMAELLS